MQECPFCGSHVEPERTEAGHLICPVCANAGVVAVESRSEPLAKASMIVGIIGVAVPLVGFVLGVVAVALSHRAEQRFLADPSLLGRAKATSGLVLGLVATCVHLMLFLSMRLGRT